MIGMMHFTKTNIAKLAVPIGKSELVIFDDEVAGFGVRLRAGGSKTYILQYRVGKRQRRLKLGFVSALYLEDARRMARKEMAKVTLGSDPQSDRKTDQIRAVNTVGAVSTMYLASAK